MHLLVSHNPILLLPVMSNLSFIVKLISLANCSLLIGCFLISCSCVVVFFTLYFLVFFQCLWFCCSTVALALRNLDLYLTRIFTLALRNFSVGDFWCSRSLLNVYFESRVLGCYSYSFFGLPDFFLRWRVLQSTPHYHFVKQCGA